MRGKTIKKFIGLPRPRAYIWSPSTSLKRVFDIDIEHCPNRGGALKIIACPEPSSKGRPFDTLRTGIEERR